MEFLKRFFKSSIAVVIVMSFIFSPIVSLKPIMAATTETVIVEESQASEPSSTNIESLPAEDTEASSEIASSVSTTDKEASSSEKASDTNSEVSSSTQTGSTDSDETTVSETMDKVEPTKEVEASEAKETKVSDELTLSEKEKAFREKLAAAGEAEENNFIIRISDGLITGYREDTVTDLVIPSTVDGHAVRGIDTKAFERKGIQSLTLPEGIETIGEEAFAQNDLRELTIPNSLLSIGVRAFAYNNHLEEIKFGNQPKLKEIKRMAFRNNDLKSFEAPDSLKKIENAAFFLNKISNLTLGSVQEIGDYAFSSNKLSEVVLPDTLTTLGSHVFDKNNRYVYTTGSSVGRTDVTMGSFGSIHNPISIKVKGVDKDTQKVIQPVVVITNDPTVEVAKSELLYEGGTLRRPAPKVPGYSSDAISLELTKENIENNKVHPYVIQYFDEKYKPSFSGLTPLEVGLNEVVDLRAGVTATSGSGEDLTSLIMINPDPLDTSVSGIFPVEYSVIDGLGNKVSEVREVLVGIDPMKIEVGGGWLMEDFVFSGSSLNGFSSLGLQKLEENKDLYLPTFNPNTKAKMTRVNSSAFENKGLYSVSIPDTYTGIGSQAFANNSLTSITLPEGLTELASYAFKENNISGNLEIPKGVKVIGSSAFQKNSIDSVVFEEGLKEIGSYAFSENNLIELTLPNSLEKIGSNSFQSNNIATLDLGAGVQEIGSSAFYKNNIYQLALPASLKRIGYSVFRYNQLTSIDVPETIDSIGTSVFADNNITEFSWPSEKLPVIPESTFSENNIEVLPDLEGLTEIGSRAFYGNNMNSVVLPSTLKKIGSYAFYGCKNLETLVLNEGLESIGSVAFGYCPIKAKVFETPSTLKEIGSYAFRDAPEFDKVILNEGLTSLGSYAFYNTNINSLTLPSTLSRVLEYTFAYTYLNELIIPEGVTYIGQSAFLGSSNSSKNKIRNLILPSTLTEIGDTAFRYQGISSLDLPDGLTKVGRYAFNGNLISDNLEIPNSVTQIGEEAFSDNNISTLRLPDSLSDIGKAAFSGNVIKTVNIPSAMTVIPEGLFSKNQIETFNIPNTVTEIKKEAFQGNRINSLTFEENSSLTTISEGAFKSNILVETTLPTSVSTIDKTAFSENPGMELKPGYVALKVLDAQGEPVNPNNLENVRDEDTNTGYMINPSYIVVKSQLADGTPVASDRYYFGKIGSSIEVTPKEGVAYTPEDPSVRNFTLGKSPREEIIRYVAKPNFDPTGYNIEIKHTNISGRSDNKPTGEKIFDVGDRMPFSIKASVTGNVEGLREPSITVDFNKLVRGGHVESIIYPDLNSLKTMFESWTFEDGILDLKFKKNASFGGPATQIEIPLSVRFQRYNTPKDYVLDLTEAVHLYDAGSLVKTSTNDVRFKANIGSLYAYKYAQGYYYGINIWHDDYDDEGYSLPDSDREVVFTYTIQSYEYSRGYKKARYYNHLYIEDILPTYEGKDADGVIQTNLRAQIDTEKSQGWVLSADGTKAIYDVDTAPAFDGTRGGTNGFTSGKLPVAPLYLKFPGVKKDLQITNRQNYTLTPHNRAKTSVVSGKKPTDEGGLVLEPLEKIYDTVEFTFKDNRYKPKGDFESRLTKDIRDFYGYNSDGVPSVVGDPKSKRITGVENYGYRNRIQRITSNTRYNSDRDSRRSGAYIPSFFDSESDRRQIFTWTITMSTVGQSPITDLVVKEFGLDDRMKYVGLYLPDDLTTAILKLYDASGAVLLEDRVNPGTYMFPEALQEQIKSFTIDFQSMVIERQNVTTEGSRKFDVYTKLKNPEISAFTDHPSNALSFSFEPNLFWNHSQMSSTVIYTNDEGVTTREHYDTNEVKQATHVLPYESATSLIKTLTSRPPGADPNTPIEDLNYGINQELRFDLKTTTLKPKDLGMKEFKFLDLLPPYLLPEEVIFSDAFLAKAQNPRFQFIQNFEGTDRWAVVITADAYNPGGKDFQAHTETFAELVTRTATNIENMVYTNEAYLTAKGDSSWNRPSENKPSYNFFEEDANVIKASAQYSVATVKNLSAFKFVKNSRDLAYSSVGTELESEEDFSYRLTLGNNTNDPVQNVVIYDVLPYYDDIRLVPNNAGQRVPRGTNLNKTGDEAMPKVSLNGPIQLDPSYADLYEVYYSTASTDTFRDADENAVTADESLWSTTVANYADVTAIRIKLKEGQQIPANSTHHFILPMKAPLNRNYQYDGMITNNSFAYRAGSNTSPFIEGNNVRTIEKSARAILEVRKKSDWPTEKDYIPGAVFQLFKVAPENASEDEVITKGDYRVYRDPVFVPQGKKYVSSLTTNKEGIASFGDLFTNTDYVLEEVSVPDGYTIPRNGSPYTLIRGSELTGTESNPRFFAKEIINHKVYFPLIKPMTASLEFYKYGVNHKPLPYTVFEISLDYDHPDFKDLNYGEGELENYKKVNFRPRRAVSTVTGKVLFDNLPIFGEKYPPYIIKEISPRGTLQPIEPFHYKPHARNGEGEKKVIGEPMVNDKAQVKLYKLGMLDLNYKTVELEKIATYMGRRLPNVLIKLYDKEDDTFIEEARTDAQGAITFSNLKLNHDYYLVEPGHVDSYRPYTDTEHENKLNFRVAVDGKILVNNKISKFRYVVMPNYPERDSNQLVIRKTDLQGQPLPGAIFELYKVHDREEFETGEEDLNPTLIATETTDEFGNVIFKDFGMGEDAGKFKVVEKKAPLGYMKTFEPFEFRTYDNALFFKELEVTNTKIKLNLNKYRIDAFNLKRPLSGAKFALYEGEDATGTPLEEATSNAQGKVPFTYNLWDTEKRYSIKELEAPEGYSLDPNVISIPLVEIVNRTNFDGSLNYERINEKHSHTGTIVITKIDKFSNTVIRDVNFTLTNEETGFEETGKTNRLGVLRFRNLPYGTYTLRELSLDGYKPLEDQSITISEEDSVQYVLVKNIPTPQSITLTKVNELDQPLANVEFELERRFTDTNWTDRVTGRTSETGTLTFDNLLRDSIYRLKELDASQATPLFEGDTYALPNDYYYIKVDKQGAITVMYKDSPVALPLSIVNERANKKSNKDLTVKKSWVGGETLRISDIQVQLYKLREYGEPKKVAIGGPVELQNVQDVLQHTFTNLPAEELVQLDDRQFYQDLEYTVEEINTPAGFTASVSGITEGQNYLKLTNTYNVPVADVQASKTWVGGPTEKPTTWFKLYRKTDAMEAVEAVPNAEVKELASGVTSVTWTGIDQTDSAANPYSFQVKEVDAQGNDATPLNYVKSQDSTDLLSVTNTYVSPKTSVTGTKAWTNGETLTKPDVWFKLYRKTDAMEAVEAVPNAEIKKLVNGTTQVTWSDLDETDGQGRAYSFAVREVNEAGDDYTPTNWSKAQTSDLTITNSYVIPTDASATATKTWVGGSAIDKPDTWFKLYRKTDAMEAVEAVPDAEVKKLVNGVVEATWTGLEKTDLQGRPYTFSVKETDAEGNDATPTNWTKRENDTLSVTNNYVSPKTSVTGTKAWTNGESLTKPDVWFKLYRKTANEEGFTAVAGAEIKKLEDGTTTATWTNLDETDVLGNTYSYKVEEVNEAGEDYTPTNWSKAQTDNLTITNSYVVPTDASATGTKAWTNGSTLTKPDTWFKLYRKTNAMEDFEAVPSGEIKKLEDGTTSVTWTGLAKTDIQGRAYSFAVREVNEAGDDYTPTNWSKAQTSDLTITNTYVIPTDASATATKTWAGGSAIDKPDTWFKLYRKTDAMEAVEAVPDAEVKKLVNGVVEATWTGLEKTDLQGRPYTFSVRETDAQGNSIAPRNWTKSGDDTLAITNTYVSPRMKLTAEKAWVDGESLTKPDIWFKLMRKTDAMTDYEAVPNAEVKKLSDGQTQIEWTDIEETDAEARTYDFVVKEVNEAGEEAVPTNWQGEQTTAFKITNSYVIPINGEVQATKTWVGGEAISKPDVWFTLYRKTVNDTEFKVVPDAEIKKLENGTTEVSWTGLEETDLQGYPYSFAVKETDAEGNAYSPENWKQVEGENLAIVNEYVPPVAEVSAEKVWVNGESLTKPDTWFKLFRKVNPAEAEVETETDAEASEATEAGVDAETGEATEVEADTETGEATDVGADTETAETTEADVNSEADLEEVPNAEVTLLSDGTTKVDWTNIDQTDKAGRVYTFYVKEVDAEGNDYTPINWKKEQTENLKITNSYVIPEDASATAEKVWVNGPEAKPSIWFKLYRKTDAMEAVEAVPNVEVKELRDGLTTVSWNNLERTNLQGEVYEFSVQEVDENGINFVPENYSKEEAGLTVTNTYVISKDATVSAEKIWVDGPSEHPTIWFTLYRKTDAMKDFERVPEALIKLLQNGTTEVSWTGLEKTDIRGNAYTFMVKETDMAGREQVPEGYKSENLGLKVKNTYIVKPKSKATVAKTGESMNHISFSVMLLAIATLITKLRRRVSQEEQA